MEPFQGSLEWWRMTQGSALTRNPGLNDGNPLRACFENISDGFAAGRGGWLRWNCGRWEYVAPTELFFRSILLIYKDFAPTGAKTQRALSKNRDAPKHAAKQCFTSSCLVASLAWQRVRRGFVLGE